MAKKKKSKRGNGEGTISQRKDGTWCAAVTVGRDPETGKLKRRFMYGKTRLEVSEKLNKTLNSVQMGSYLEVNTLTVGEWLDIWLQDYAKLNLRTATWTLYEMLARVHIKPQIGHYNLAKLQPHHLQKLYNEKFESGRVDGKGGLSARTVQLIHTVMHLALEQAIKDALISRNISEHTKLPRREAKEIRVLSIEEQQLFMSVLDEDRMGAAYMLDLGSGLRRGELLALRWQDVNLQEGIIKVNRSLSRVKSDNGITKTELRFQPLKTKKSQRSVPIPGIIVAELRKHKARQNEERLAAGAAYEDNGLLFCTEFGKPIDPMNFNRKFYQLRLLHNSKITL